MMVRRISTILALGLAAAVSTTSERAQAAGTTCKVNNIGWHDSGGGTLQINCGGTWYYGFGSAASCPTASADTRKAWLRIATAAAMSGRTVTLDYSSCPAGNGLSNVTLNSP